jgi:hypothetical protein
MKAGTVMRLDKYCHVSLRLSLHQLAPVSSSVVGVETVSTCWLSWVILSVLMENFMILLSIILFTELRIGKDK